MSLPFRQTVIAASLAVIRIPAKQAQSNQETKKPMNACPKMPQSAENSGCLSGVDFENDDEAPALPVFRDNVKIEQAAVVKTIGARMREARQHHL